MAARPTPPSQGRKVDRFTVPVFKGTVTNYYILVADSIEDASRSMWIFFMILQNMKEELQYANSRKCQEMFRIQSGFKSKATDYIEWLDFQVSNLERMYLAINVKLARANGVDPLLPRPRLPANRTLRRIGRVFSQWLRHNPGFSDNLYNAKDKIKHYSKGRNIEIEVKKQLPEEVLPAPKGDRDSLLSLFGDASDVDGAVLPQGAGGGAQQALVSGANCADVEGVADTAQAPLSEGYQAAGEGQSGTTQADSDITSSFEPNPNNWSTMATIGNLSSSDDGRSERQRKHSVKARSSSEGSDENKTPSTAAIDRDSTPAAVLYEVWRLVDWLLRLYSYHLRRVSLVQLYLWDCGMEAADEDALPYQVFAHLRNAFDFTEEELIGANRQLIRVANAARMLDNTDWWPVGRMMCPQIPVQALRPFAARPVMPLGLRFLRFFRYLCSCYQPQYR